MNTGKVPSTFISMNNILDGHIQLFNTLHVTLRLFTVIMNNRVVPPTFVHLSKPNFKVDELVTKYIQ